MANMNDDSDLRKFYENFNRIGKECEKVRKEIEEKSKRIAEECDRIGKEHEKAEKEIKEATARVAEKYDHNMKQYEMALINQWIMMMILHHEF